VDPAAVNRLDKRALGRRVAGHAVMAVSDEVEITG
jgi:hypothetical protein